MKVWILVCGAAETPLPKRCTGTAFEQAQAAEAESAIVLYTGRTMKAAGRAVYVAPGRRARETAEQVIPGAELTVEQLLAPIPYRAWQDAAGEKPLWLWQWMARRQARAGNPRQPESREASIARAEELIGKLEKEERDCLLVLDGDLTLLVNKGDEQRVELSPDLPESVPAPVQPGDVVGRVNVIVDGRSVAQIPVATAEGVEAKGMALDRIWRNWMGHF